MVTGENKITNIKTDNFNISLSCHYHLSMQIGIQHFSYCILNNKSLTYEFAREYNNLSANHYTTEISEIINNDQILKAEFSSISVAFVNLVSTLVPDLLYKEEEKESFLAFNTQIKGKIVSEDILSQKAKLIYAIPNEINNIINNFFPNAKQKSQESILLHQYSQLNSKKEEAYLYLNEHEASITIFKYDKLVFNNKFNYITKEDLLYFILFSFEQANVSPDQISFTLFGSIEEQGDTFKLLYEYIRNMKLGKRPYEFSFPVQFKTISNHRYFGLFSQVLCV